MHITTYHAYLAYYTYNAFSAYHAYPAYPAYMYIMHIMHILHIMHITTYHAYCDIYGFIVNSYKDRHRHECVYVSVLEEYTGPRKPGHILHIIHIFHILNCVCTTAWVGQCQSAMIYERREQAQRFHCTQPPLAEVTKLLCPHHEGAGAPHPFRVGGKKNKKVLLRPAASPPPPHPCVCMPPSPAPPISSDTGPVMTFD